MIRPVLAQEAKSLDEKVNAIFSSVTGPFVGPIFAPFPGTSFP
ncbi:MAG: AGCS family alanine or glycine:cation symporter [Gammaproteobacteria bacterium]|jgi:AGCS family alanine or glycine:cation symporter